MCTALVLYGGPASSNFNNSRDVLDKRNISIDKTNYYCNEDISVQIGGFISPKLAERFEEICYIASICFILISFIAGVALAPSALFFAHGMITKWMFMVHASIFIISLIFMKVFEKLEQFFKNCSAKIDRLEAGGAVEKMFYGKCDLHWFLHKLSQILPISYNSLPNNIGYCKDIKEVYCDDRLEQLRAQVMHGRSFRRDQNKPVYYGGHAIIYFVNNLILFVLY